MRLQKLFTDTNMHDPTLREEMEVFYRTLLKILRDDQLTIPSTNYDLVLDIMPDNDKIKWSYYYACHETRCLFWLEEYDGSYMISEIGGVECPALVSASESRHGSEFANSVRRAPPGRFILARKQSLA
jgi:hypothetical protein